MKKLIIYFCSVFIILILTISVLYSYQVIQINSNYKKQFNIAAEVTLRKFPYPFQAAMTICSDIDNTGSLDEFLTIQNYLNTNKETAIGKGLNMEIGNTFLMYESPSTISYMNSSTQVTETIIKLIHSGYIDVLHSYGKKINFTRDDAIIALNNLNNNKCFIDTWIDHSITNDNLGNDDTYGLGDIQNAKEYHADLTIAYGIKHVWLSRGTMIIGQTVPIHPRLFLNIYDSDYPLKSLKNIVTEFSKHLLANFGNKKYAMHRNNDLVKITTLDDGQKVYEFTRFDIHPSGISLGANAKGLAYVISNENLEKLIDVKGYMIVYTHFGQNSGIDDYLPIQTRNALKNLSRKNQSGKIYITTTSKLLNYYIRHKYLNWTFKKDDNAVLIYIHNIEDPIFGPYIPTIEQLQGITFYIPDHKEIKLFIDGKQVFKIIKNDIDYVGRKSVSVPLTRLTYPLN